MEALTPASPDSLPPLGELIADEPFWRYPIGTARAMRKSPHVAKSKSSLVASKVPTPRSLCRPGV